MPFLLPSFLLSDALPPTSAASLKVDYANRRGLTVGLDGVPLVQGSWFQYYAPGFTKGYYSSLYADQRVMKTPDGYRATFASPDGLVSGTVDVKLSPGQVETRYHFEWSGPQPALIEIAAGELYAEPWRATKPALAAVDPPDPADAKAFGRRLLGSNLREITFGDAPVKMTLNALPGETVFDANGYNQDWAQGRSLYWAGRQGIPVEKGKPADLVFTYRFEGTYGSPTSGTAVGGTVGVKAIPAVAAVGQSTRLPLIPTPKLALLDYDHPLEITGLWALPAGRPRRFDDLLAALARRFEMPKGGPGKARVAIDGGISDLKLTEGAYRLNITSKAISVIGEKDDGLYNGMERLAQLAFAKDGKLYIPTGHMEDEPRRQFRGVHLFVGPKAREFQERLWTRVLRPLGFNRVVLQCERTKWESVPGIETPLTMPKDELTKLFKWYRAHAVEPIPLVQSWGHAEWLFANGQNLDLAYNREIPYALDPRKPEAQALLKRLWSEVIAATDAKTIHFGLDEVDLLGMKPSDGALVTQMWRQHLPFLGTIAQDHGVDMMLWGDELLAPGEAPDATSARTRTDAQARRDAVPKGSFVADWHYKADPRPQSFLKPLQTLKTDGLRPIASSWYHPENVRGFNLAADLERVGTLQTTWSGYESDEASLVANLAQFDAMVLAADYSWSARQDALNKLGYDPAVIFRRMYFGEPQPLGARRGYVLGPVAGPATGPRGDLALLLSETGVRVEEMAIPVRLRSLGDGLELPMDATLRLAEPVAASRICLLAGCATRLGVGDPVGTAEITLADGRKLSRTLVYGLDLVAPNDPSATTRAASALGASLISIDLPPNAKIAQLRFVAAAPHTGLLIRGATLL